MPKQKQQRETVERPERLTDEEADYLLQQLGHMLADRVPPQVFYRAFGRGVVYAPADADREAARRMARLLAHGEG